VRAAGPGALFERLDLRGARRAGGVAMMQPVLFKVKLFRGAGDFERSKTALLWMLEALCQINEGHLAQFPYPPLYQAGVRYQREVNTEEWLDIPTVIEAGWGDCEDLACWRVAELRRQGVTASPYVKFRRVDGVYHFHALVGIYEERAGATLESHDAGVVLPETRLVRIQDPSLRLGMGWEKEFARQQALASRDASTTVPGASSHDAGRAG
jgi:hypothetical protein